MTPKKRGKLQGSLALSVVGSTRFMLVHLDSAGMLSVPTDKNGTPLFEESYSSLEEAGRAVEKTAQLTGTTKVMNGSASLGDIVTEQYVALPLLVVDGTVIGQISSNSTKLNQS